MLIIRAKRPDTQFTVLRNKVLRDERISFRARGVLTAILSRPDDWRTDAETLSRESPKEGRDAIRTALNELEEAGYLIRERYRLENGQYATNSYIYDEPQRISSAGEPQRETSDGFSGSLQRNNTKKRDKELTHGVVAEFSPVQTIVATFVDTWVELHSEKPLSKSIAILGRDVKKMVADGADVERLIESARKCARDGHVRIDSAYAWITAESTRQMGSKRLTNINEGLALIHRLEENEAREITSENIGGGEIASYG